MTKLEKRNSKIGRKREPLPVASLEERHSESDIRRIETQKADPSLGMTGQNRLPQQVHRVSFFEFRTTIFRVSWVWPAASRSRKESFGLRRRSRRGCARRGRGSGRRRGQ